MVLFAVQQEFFPPDYLSIGRYLFDLAPFHQIISFSFYRAQDIFYAGEDQVTQVDIFPDILKLAVKLVKGQAYYAG